MVDCYYYGLVMAGRNESDRKQYEASADMSERMKYTLSGVIRGDFPSSLSNLSKYIASVSGRLGRLGGTLEVFEWWNLRGLDVPRSWKD